MLYGVEVSKNLLKAAGCLKKLSQTLALFSQRTGGCAKNFSQAPARFVRRGLKNLLKKRPAGLMPLPLGPPRLSKPRDLRTLPLGPPRLEAARFKELATGAALAAKAARFKDIATGAAPAVRKCVKERPSLLPNRLKNPRPLKEIC